MTEFKVPEPDLQIAFYHRLQEIRNICLLDALLSTVAHLEITEIDRQLAEFVSNTGLQQVAVWGLRGELVFAVPCVLHKNPQLLGYYRLLLGVSQKEFYGNRYGFGRFKIMEERGRISAKNADGVTDLCRVLCKSGESLAENVGPLSRDGVHELTLLTLGPQLRGGALNILGNIATRKIFGLIQSLLPVEIVADGERSMEVRNAAGRIVRIEFAADPDICIKEELPSGKSRSLIAIEIKGGKDHSNIHNRIGEAEKSHQKAKNEGYVECWTIVGIADLAVELAKQESPTTDKFYHIDRIMERDSEECSDFRENLLARIGLMA
uniref:XcyI restriction endonuclease n=1 Tax=Candidatus Kentrum sp. LPFa TaxID=2126335 RepID=A0A450WV70_9GAMM|nr:MAG: XcyI restriction endonuclease [Candidatus Kentron sp. LPFa]